jgi:mevalonate kinase
MLDTIDLITTEAHDIISDPDFSSDPGSDSLTRLGDLIRINHGLLVSLGVSHPKLERIRELIDHTGIGWTKLTGAGGGGCSITLLKPNVKQSVLKELEVKLGEEGFEKYETTLGGPGVGVMWPATIWPEDLDGREVVITEDMILGAEGMPGVEALCGVGVPGGGKWRFWTEFVDRDTK